MARLCEVNIWRGSRQFGAICRRIAVDRGVDCVGVHAPSGHAWTIFLGASTVVNFDAYAAPALAVATDLGSGTTEADRIAGNGEGVSQSFSATSESLANLITRELPKLKRLAWLLVRDDDHANDLVQDTIVRVLTYAHNWQPGTNFGAWIKTVMRNQFYTECGQRSRESKTIVRQDETPDNSVAPPQDERLACNELRAAIERLPRNQRVALTFAAFEGLSSEEIAARMQISPNAVRCHLMRARKQLRGTIAQDPKSEPLDESSLAFT